MTSRFPLALPIDYHRVTHPPIQIHSLHPPPFAQMHKGLSLTEFYSGATRLSGRLNEGLLLRRSQDDRGDRLEILCGPDYRDRYDLCQFEGNTETHIFSEMPDALALPIVDMKKEIVALDIEAVLSDKMD